MRANPQGIDRDTDEALCLRAASGDRIAEEQLVMRYMRLVRARARPYFLAGGDSEDLTQEGMIGLLTAIRVFDPTKGASFRTYAETCIKNRLISAVKAASRVKHAPLNDSVPFEPPLFDTSSDGYPYRAPRQRQEDPEVIMIGREELQEQMDMLKSLSSSFERKVLGLYLGGSSYSEIAAEVNRSPKAVDNAVQRIRRKLAQQI